MSNQHSNAYCTQSNLKEEFVKPIAGTKEDTNLAFFLKIGQGWVCDGIFLMVKTKDPVIYDSHS